MFSRSLIEAVDPRRDHGGGNRPAVSCGYKTLFLLATNQTHYSGLG